MPDFTRLRDISDQFGPSAALDIALIAVVIYSALRLLSGTRAMTQLRGGLAVVLVAVVLGRIFDLTVVNFFIDRSLTALLIGGAIIFQPELRRALDRLGRTGASGWFNRPQYSDVIESLVEATRHMSAVRHGGLFVLERSTGLQDVIDTGVPVDARVSPQLLSGIFFPNSPLHDMAVVLREERVVAAGCVLPLANDLPYSERQLGTRHRAAIGITEHTDALSVVVSEETGDISVALGGRLTHVDDEDRLRDVLKWLLAPVPDVARSRNGRAPV
ncbi:MAG: TIGR00159 family protein [Chloroflexi bacterium]|nr:TIGR00159 family protein [Chloroflexota bacterium]